MLAIKWYEIVFDIIKIDLLLVSSSSTLKGRKIWKVKILVVVVEMPVKWTTIFLSDDFQKSHFECMLWEICIDFYLQKRSLLRVF